MSKGTYELVGKRVLLEMEGVLWGTNKSSWRYTFENRDRLLLTDCDKVADVTLTLERVK